MKYFLIIVSLAYLLTSCATTSHEIDTQTFPRYHPQKNELVHLVNIKPLPLRDRLAWPVLKMDMPVQTHEKLYTFVAKDMPIRKAIQLFAKAYKLNILIDKEVLGTINVSFHDLPFNQAMASILDTLGYYWEQDKGLITIKLWQTRLFSINYINLIRTGSGSSEAQVSSGGGGDSGGSGGSGGGNTSGGKISVQQENTVDFWGMLDQQLKVLISPKGRLVINRLSGTVQVTDVHPRVMEVSLYLDDINSAIHRQVDIEVKIIEVELNDDYSLGVDWSRLVNQGEPGTNLNFNINSSISSPAGASSILPSVLSLAASDIASNGDNKLTAMITALQQQGEVTVVSQPHIRTMNNQSALIKVGTDRTFFRREQSTDNTSAGSNTTTTDVPQVVTEGIVLSITPQISKDGWVMMDISPVVTRVSSIAEVKDKLGNIQSSAPNLDIRQTSALVRAFNGETVVIGGLIQTLDGDTKRGVPGLDDIPTVGNMFKATYNTKTKRELIIFLTPKIIDTTAIFSGQIE